MIIGKKKFDTAGHTYIMGILNVTPDSFSDGGKWNSVDRALAHTEEMLEEGADIIDIGGESTRPGYTMLTEEEEIRRIVPVIKEIKKRFEVPISLDTYKSAVAQAGIEAGADMINDIWGLRYDAKMGEVIARGNVACTLTHNRKDAVYDDFAKDVISDLEESLEMAENAGIPYERICVDPGIGFGKTCRQNLQVIGEMEMLHTFGLPILLGASRKSFIGMTLGLPVGERMEGTLAVSTIAVMKGVSFVRVHDVKENMRAIRMAEEIRNTARL